MPTALLAEDHQPTAIAAKLGMAGLTSYAIPTVQTDTSMITRTVQSVILNVYCVQERVLTVLLVCFQEPTNRTYRIRAVWLAVPLEPSQRTTPTSAPNAPMNAQRVQAHSLQSVLHVPQEISSAT